MEKEYRVNEIFYSLQGEGRNAGRAAVFVRLSGCNLRCPFCDTDFSSYEQLTADTIVERMLQTLSDSTAAMPMVVLTGGEPTLQADENLVDAMHRAGFSFVAMESNGTHEPPANIDWLTLSPKDAEVVVGRCEELKVLFDGTGNVDAPDVEADYHYLQPIDTGDRRRNKAIVAACVEYIKHHPRWRLSLQTHKLIDIR